METLGICFTRNSRRALQGSGRKKHSTIPGWSSPALILCCPPEDTVGRAGPEALRFQVETGHCQKGDLLTCLRADSHERKERKVPTRALHLKKLSYLIGDVVLDSLQTGVGCHPIFRQL